MKGKIKNGNGLSLLLDTNTHDFELVECLKWLRQFLTLEPVVKKAVNRVAFVQPGAYRKTEIVSIYGAYFTDKVSAKKWLNLA